MKRTHPKRVAAPPVDVFISHATSDKWLASVLCEKLEGIGATTFRDDRDIDGGDDIPDSIRDAIGACDELLVLLTPDSVNRPWVLLEVGAAWQAGKRIVAIRCHVSIEPVPAILKSKRVMDLNECDRYLSDVKKRLSP